MRLDLAKVIGAASRILPCAAVPASSATARKVSRASGDVGSTLRAAAIGEQKSAAAVSCDAIRIGKREERAGRHGLPRPPCRASRAGEPPPTAWPCGALLHPPRAVAAKFVEAMSKIDVVAAEPAFAQQGGDVGGHVARRPSAAASTTMRASRGGSGRRRSLLPFSVIRPAASMAPSSAQQRLASIKRRRRRRIEESERSRIGDTPLRKIEHEAGQIGGENFRLAVGLERSGLRLVPEPVADAGLRAAGAAAALIGGGARDPHGLQPGQAHIRLVTRHARQARCR